MKNLKLGLCFGAVWRMGPQTIERQSQLTTSRSETKPSLGLECKSVIKRDYFPSLVSLIHLQLCRDPYTG